MEYDCLKSTNSTISNATVAKSYFGSVQVSCTMTMLASLSIRFPKPVIDAIGEIINAEHPDLYDSSETIDGTDYNYENHDNMIDYRVYRKLLRHSFHSIDCISQRPSWTRSQMLPVNLKSMHYTGSETCAMQIRFAWYITMMSENNIRWPLRPCSNRQSSSTTLAITHGRITWTHADIIY